MKINYHNDKKENINNGNVSCCIVNLVTNIYKTHNQKTFNEKYIHVSHIMDNFNILGQINYGKLKIYIHISVKF